MPFSIKQGLRRLALRKPIERSLQQIESDSIGLSWYHLLAYGISATIGGGIYVVVGQVAHELTGPSVIFSILGSGLLSVLTAFVYLELAAMIPVSGSSYIYGYTFLGEAVGFFLGWTSTLEYAFAASVTAVTMTKFGVEMIHAMTGSSVIPLWLYDAIPSDSPVSHIFEVNILAFCVIVIITFIVLRGLDFSTRFNTFLTVFNFSVLIFIVIFGACQIDVNNYSPFFPFPVSNIFHGAATIIYSYIGFDTICNLSGDARSPLDLQIGVVGTVMTATTLYITVAFVLTGIVHYSHINPSTSLASSFSTLGYEWAAYIVRCCALLMMIATLLACLIGQPRLFGAMAKDGLLPRIFLKTNKSNIAVWNIFICSALAALIALAIKIYELVDLISLGALVTWSFNAVGLILSRCEQHPSVLTIGRPLTLIFAFGSLLSAYLLHHGFWIAAIVLGITLSLAPMIGLFVLFWIYQDSLQSPLKNRSLCPLMPLIPCLSILGNAIVMPTIPALTFLQFLIWTVLGFILYFGYGYTHSTLEENILTEKWAATEAQKPS